MNNPDYVTGPVGGTPISVIKNLNSQENDVKTRIQQQQISSYSDNQQITNLVKNINKSLDNLDKPKKKSKRHKKHKKINYDLNEEINKEQSTSDTNNLTSLKELILFIIVYTICSNNVFKTKINKYVPMYQDNILSIVLYGLVIGVIYLSLRNLIF
jgi:hypothetical protein